MAWKVKPLSLFEKTDVSSPTPSEEVMKNLVFRLIAHSPKAKLRYGMIQDVLKKPSSVALPECTCTTKRTCVACNRLASMRGKKIMNGAAQRKMDKSVPKSNSEQTEISVELLDDTDPSFYSKLDDQSSEGEDEENAAVTLQSLFQAADSDARRSAKESLRSYRKELLSNRTKRLTALSTEVKSRDACVLSDFAERRKRLETELSSAQKAINDAASGPISPVSAMIRELEQHRISRDSEFRSRMESIRSTDTSAEVEKCSTEIGIVIGKFQILLTRISQLPNSENVSLQEEATKLKQNLENKLTQLSSISVDQAKLDVVSQIVVEANRIADESSRIIEKLASSMSSTPAVKVETQSADKDCQNILPESRQFVESWRERLKPLLENPPLKQQRSDLQRAVFSLVNMLSTESSSSSGVLLNLSRLLDGENVEVSGRPVSASFHPLGTDFVKLAICKKFIGQAEEEISSQPSIALPLATAALGLVFTRPDMAQLFVTYFYTVCPMLVPVDVVMDVNVDRVFEQLGYKRRPDGQYEGIERFLKRVGGIVTLFCSMAVAPVPSSASTGSRPITVATIWTLLIRLLRQSPFPDVTATVLYEILKVCSKRLFETYRRQFDKLAKSIKTVFVPRLEALAEGDSGSVATLRHFINTEVAAICGWPLPQKQ